MGSLSQVFGFPVDTYRSFRFDGKRCRLRKCDVRALRSLAKIAHEWTQEGKPHLVSRRDQLQEIIRANPRVVLTRVLDHAEDEHILRLTLWLRGQCGGTLGTASVAQFAHASKSRALRKEAALALTRLSGWSELREIEASDPDPRIRRIAAQRPATAFEERLSTFGELVEPREISTRTPSLFVDPVLEERGFKQHRPPRTGWFISTILRRIHRYLAEQATTEAKRS